MRDGNRLHSRRKSSCSRTHREHALVVNPVSDFLQLAFDRAAYVHLVAGAKLAQVKNAAGGADNFLRLVRFDLHALQRVAEGDPRADGQPGIDHYVVPSLGGAFCRKAHFGGKQAAGCHPLVENGSQQSRAAHSDRAEEQQEPAAEQVIHRAQNTSDGALRSKEIAGRV